MIKNLVMIVATVFLNTAGQFMMKAGINKIGKIGFANMTDSFIKVISSGYIISGFCFYAISAVLWIIILSRSELSWAFPMVSLSYVITALLAPALLNETFSIPRLVGILVICAGVFLVSRTYN